MLCKHSTNNSQGLFSLLWLKLINAFCQDSCFLGAWLIIQLFQKPLKDLLRFGFSAYRRIFRDKQICGGLMKRTPSENNALINAKIIR